MTANAGNLGPSGASATPNQHAPMTTLLTEQDAAALLKVTKKTLQAWRYRGAGPQFLKVGRCVRYRPEDLQTFVLMSLRSSTSDPGATLPDRPGLRVSPPLEHTGRALDRGETARPPLRYAMRRRPPKRPRHARCVPSAVPACEAAPPLRVERPP
jgi:hypothetical protein